MSWYLEKLSGASIFQLPVAEAKTQKIWTNLRWWTLEIESAWATFRSDVEIEGSSSPVWPESSPQESQDSQHSLPEKKQGRKGWKSWTGKVYMTRCSDTILHASKILWVVRTANSWCMHNLSSWRCICTGRTHARVGTQQSLGSLGDGKFGVSLLGEDVMNRL